MVLGWFWSGSGLSGSGVVLGGSGVVLDLPVDILGWLGKCALETLRFPKHNSQGRFEAGGFESTHPKVGPEGL